MLTEPHHLLAVAGWLEGVVAGSPVPTPQARDVVTADWRARARQVREAVEAFRAQHAPRLGVFTPTVLTVDLEALMARAREADGKWFGKKKRRLAISNEIASHVRSGATLELGSLTAQLSQLVAVRDGARELAAWVAQLPGVSLPFGWNPLQEEDARTLQSTTDRLQAAADLAALGPTVDELTEQVRRSSTDLPSDVVSQVETLQRSWHELEAALAVTDHTRREWLAGHPLLRRLAESSSAWLTDAAGDTLVQLQRWVRVCAAVDAFDQWGMPEVGRLVLEAAAPPHQVEDRVRIAVAQAVLTERLEAAGLSHFDEKAQARSVRDFVDTSDAVRDLMRRQLPAQLVAARTFDARARAGRSAEFMTLLAGKRAKVGVRRLLRDYGSIITEVTPCLLMSPSSVARFLPADMTFDVVVFDEASQIRVAESIGSLGRGRSVVVVGDSKQMPPSSSFSVGAVAAEGDNRDEDATVVSDGESILDEAVESRLSTLSLTWHYRSRDESLIAFSNQAYYDSRLASFPAPPGRDTDMGVSWQRVHGQWEGGSGAARVNRAEADAVVEEVRSLLRIDPSRSIGVVTFNTQQRDLILDKLELSDDPLVRAALEREDEPLFVKNLENVQGDERDVILFTLAFAKDTRGKVPLNWGPLTRAGGERRLNVAITRAKERVVVFSSFDPEELDLGTSASIGLAHLKDYLLMAKHGAERARLAKQRPPEAHLEEVAAALREAGLEVRVNVGLSDFTVDLAVRSRPDRPWVAVLLDGPAWAKRSTVNDREALPSTVLGSAMGWEQVVRVWLPTWLRDRQAVIDAVLAAADGAAPAPEAAAVPASSTPVPPSTPPSGSTPPLAPSAPRVVPRGTQTALEEIVEQTPSGRDATMDPLFRSSDVAAVPTPSAGARSVWRAADETPVGDSSTLDLAADLPRARREVLRQIDAVLDVEAPVLAGRLARIVGRRFGLSAVRDARREQIIGLVPREQVRTAANGDLVVWAAGQDPGTWATYRTPDVGSRDVSEVAYEELRAAMVDIARQAHGIDRGDLLKEVSVVFGSARLAGRSRTRLEGALEALLREEELREGDGYVRVE